MNDDRATTRLLVVDDDDVMRRLLRRQLEAAGHAIADCADLASARAQLKQGRFDLVLLDLHLGAESGLDLLSTPPVVEMPSTIVLSGACDDAAIQRACELGVCDFLQKPVSGAVLQSHVRHALRARRSTAPPCAT